MKKIVFGALLLLNAFLWPMWTGIDGWVAWIAALMVVGGVVKLAVPNNCAGCKAMMAGEAKSPAKKKKSTRRRR